MPRKPADESRGGRLFEAIGSGDVETVQALLAESSSIALFRASKDRLFESIPHWLYAGDTPLHLASAALQPEVVSALLVMGGDPAAINRRGATPLHYACDPRPQIGVWDPARQVRIIDLLVRAGTPVSLPDRGGATPLHRAIRARSAAAVRCLLSHGADVNARSKERGSTPLHLAVTGSGASGTADTRDEQQQIIVALLESGANPSATDWRGRTVLALARSEEVQRFLASAV